jgi:hypothetical protein
VADRAYEQEERDDHAWHHHQRHEHPDGQVQQVEAPRSDTSVVDTAWTEPTAAVRGSPDQGGEQHAPRTQRRRIAPPELPFGRQRAGGVKDRRGAARPKSAWAAETRG